MNANFGGVAKSFWLKWKRNSAKFQPDEGAGMGRWRELRRDGWIIPDAGLGMFMLFQVLCWIVLVTFPSSPTPFLLSIFIVASAAANLKFIVRKFPANCVCRVREACFVFYHCCFYIPLYFCVILFCTHAHEWLPGKGMMFKAIR